MKLRLSLLPLLAILSPVLLRADDLRPDTTGAPIFCVFPLLHGASNQVTIDQKHPLLSVEALSDFMLKTDKRRVRVVLTNDDARAMTQILHTFTAVAITAGDTTAVLSGERFDGSLTFDNPVAGYLRRRFHIKSDSNDVLPVPASPFAPPSP